jgi:hypothetical protein
MKKPIIIGAGLLILVFWGDVVLEWVGEILVILLETLELLTEELLEAMLALTPYQAQAVTAWLGFGVFSLLLVVVLRKLVGLAQRFRITGPVWWQEEKVRLRAMYSSIGWPLGVLGLVLILVLIYLI